MTYALGRGLERYDRPTVKDIVDGLAAEQITGSPAWCWRSSTACRSRCEEDDRGATTMIITGKHLSATDHPARHGRGGALPMLDAMTPALAAAAATGRSRADPPGLRLRAERRRPWSTGRRTPTGDGFEFTRILKPLEPSANDMLVLSGLMDHNGNALGDGPGDHARAGASFLTGVHPQEDGRRGIKSASRSTRSRRAQVGEQTRFASLELGCEDHARVGNCDSGYSCAYTNSISWRSADHAACRPRPIRAGLRAAVRHATTGLDPADARAAHGVRAAASSTSSQDRHAVAAERSRRNRPAQAGRVPLPRSARSRSASQSAEKDAPQRVPAVDEDPAGIPVAFAELREADVRSAGARVPGRPDARRDLMIGARRQHADLPRDRRPRPAPSADAPPQQSGVDREGGADQHVPREHVRVLPRAS